MAEWHCVSKKKVGRGWKSIAVLVVWKHFRKWTVSQQFCHFCGDKWTLCMSRRHLLSQNLVSFVRLPMVLALYLLPLSLPVLSISEIELCWEKFWIAMHMRILMNVDMTLLAIVVVAIHTCFSFQSIQTESEMGACQLACVCRTVVGLEESSWFTHDWMSCDHNLHWTYIACHSCYYLCFICVGFRKQTKVKLICS